MISIHQSQYCIMPEWSAPYPDVKKKPMSTRKIDHIVYTVSNLEAAIADLTTRLGVRPVIGGRHDTRGTRNALVNLDNGAYLEILAADDENTAVSPPRWMGVDVLTGPKITRWALKSDDLTADAAILKNTDPALGETKAGSRQRPDGSWLRWQLIMPTATPEVDVLPFMVDWSGSDVHPHEVLPDTGCGIINLFALHPEPGEVKTTLNTLGWDMPVLSAPEAGLRLVLRCPAGIVEL